MFRKSCALGLLLTLGMAPAWARKHKYTDQILPLTPQQTELVRKAIAREKVTISQIRKNTPVVQTYIQNVRPDPKLYQVPVSDEYTVARVDFGKGFTADLYENKATKSGRFHGTFKYFEDLTKSFHLTDNPTGFMDMMFVDPTGFDQQHYTFAFVRREFLGSIRTTVFDVRPKTHTGAGRFFGRIWVEDENGNIVRFNGTYSNNPNDEENHYYHFDSWRSNVQPGVWLPLAIYVEETQRTPSSKAEGLRGQTYYWGYSLKIPQRESEAESVQVEGAEDQSQNAADLSPLQAEREWISQAEQNVLDRLQQAGLLAAPSDFDKLLETVTNNIIIGNKLELPSDIHCRVLLTEPLESLAVGNTILLSKGLVDTLPSEEDLAAVISFQLAQIVMGHHIDTRYAFNDRLLFPDEAAFQRINMNHSLGDNESASKRAMELFRNSVYASKSGNVGLYFEQLESRSKALKSLLTPRLGDSLLRPDGQPWLAGFLQGAPRLEMDNLQQIAALPLNSRLKIDSWNDKVQMLNVRPAALLNARDKMPFEITPIYFRLQRYEDQQQANQPPAGPGTPPANDGAPQTNPGPTTGQSAPPPAETQPAPPPATAPAQPQ